MDMQTRVQRLSRAKVGLVVVDIQERLLPAIFEKERLIQNAVLLIRGAAVLVGIASCCWGADSSNGALETR